MHIAYAWFSWMTILLFLMDSLTGSGAYHSEISLCETKQLDHDLR